MKIGEKKYYCVDIETSGFDPLKEEILEVGLVGFTVGNNGFKITEKWSKVFKPTKPVSPRVLALTGITQKELEKGAKFSEYSDYLQKKLGQSVIVGHNVIFDIKFLETAGLKFSGSIVDTLDLAQIFLPTHHSYNLENLAYTLNLKHKDAHRALPDCLATLGLLKNIAGLFQQLPKKERLHILEMSKTAGLPYADIFSISKKLAVKVKFQKNSIFKIKKNGSFKLNSASVYAAPPLSEWQDVAAVLLKSSKKPLLLVMPHRYQVFQLWHAGLAKGVFSSELGVDWKKESVLEKTQASDPVFAKFFMKLAVWRSQNWQQEYPIDLNLSFSGGKFLPLVCGKALPKKLPQRVLCCDYQTFFLLKGQSCFSGRQAVIFGLEDFEDALTATAGYSLSWGYLIKVLKSIYDPETESGQNKLKNQVEKALADVDLFFGLAKGLAYKLNHGFGNLEVSGHMVNSHEYLNITQAAFHLAEKLEAVNKFLASPDIKKIAEKLKVFFGDQPGCVKWLEMSEWRFAFHNRPLNIVKESQSFFRGFSGTSFISFSASNAQRQYFINRLGLGNLLLKDDLFKFQMKPVFQAPLFHICGFDGELSKRDILKKLKKGLPASVVVSGQKEVDELVPALLEHFDPALVSAQSKHGGTNKLFNNFNLKKFSVLVTSSNLVLKFLNNSQNSLTTETLGMKSTFLTQLPMPWPMDPYHQALLSSEQGQEFALARGFYSLLLIIKFYYSKKLKQIFVYLPKNQLIYKEELVSTFSKYLRILS